MELTKEVLNQIFDDYMYHKDDITVVWSFRSTLPQVPIDEIESSLLGYEASVLPLNYIGITRKYRALL